jgi:hypothetical protein
MSMPDDELIDQVARAMTRGEPSPALRQAVRARLEGEPGLAQQARRWGLPSQAPRMWAPALAAAVVVVLMLIWPGTVSGPRVDPLRSTRIASVPYVTPPVMLQPAPQIATVHQVETAVRPRGPGRASQRSIVVDPLVIEPISVPLIAVDSSSGAMPIEIEPLQIEPLQPH